MDMKKIDKKIDKIIAKTECFENRFCFMKFFKNSHYIHVLDFESAKEIFEIPQIQTDDQKFI